MSKHHHKGKGTEPAPQATPKPEPPAGFDFAKLALGSPLAEFEAFARQRIKVAERLSTPEELDLYLEAVELGRQLLGTDAKS